MCEAGKEVTGEEVVAGKGVAGRLVWECGRAMWCAGGGRCGYVAVALVGWRCGSGSNSVVIDGGCWRVVVWLSLGRCGNE